MPRLIKFAIFGFLAYAVVTATPAQQAEIGQGVVAIKDAAIEACTREGSLCARVIAYVTGAVGNSLSDEPAPWLDDQAKRPMPPKAS